MRSYKLQYKLEEAGLILLEVSLIFIVARISVVVYELLQLL
jgi:hypothetical protein